MSTHFVFDSVRHLYPVIHLNTPLQKLSWIDGQPLSESVSKLEFDIKNDGDFEWYDYFRPAANIPLFSPELKEIIESHSKTSMEFIGAIVNHVPSGETRKYYAANILDIVLGLDREESDFEAFDNHEYLVEELYTLRLDEEKLASHAFCRLKEYPLIILCNNELKDLIEKSQLKGVLFEVPEKWNGF